MKTDKRRVVIAAWSVAVIGIGGVVSPVWARTDIIAQSGDELPDDQTGTIDNSFPFGRPVLNDAGQVAFRTRVADGQLGNLGLYVGTADGPLIPIARSGQPVPEGVQGRTIGNFFTFQPQISHDGQVVFHTQINDPIQSGPLEAIYVGSGGPLTAVIRTGSKPPSRDGNFSTFAPGAISQNDAGQVAFRSTVFNSTPGNGGTGFYLRSSSTYTEIVRTGLPAPDGDGQFSISSSPVLNNLGQVAFSAHTVDATTGSRDGIFLHDGQNLSVLAREGQTVPGGDGKFGTIPPLIRIGDGGHVAFYADVENSAKPRGLFLASGETVSAIALNGQQAPDSSHHFDEVGVASVPTKMGQVVFGARIDSPTNESGLYRYDNGSVTKLIHAGQQLSNSDELLTSVSHFGTPNINSTGQIAFSGTAGFHGGVFLTDGQEVIMAVRGGQPLTEGELNITGFDYIGHSVHPDGGINQQGQIALKARFGSHESIVLFTPDLRWRRDTSGAWDDVDHWTIGLAPAHVHDVFIDPDQAGLDLTITGPAEDTTIHSLTVGSGDGQASLQLGDGVLASTQAVVMAQNGQLTGQGTIDGDLLIAGLVNPGLAMGSIRVTGDTDFEPGGSFMVDLADTDSGTEHDLLEVGQTARLAGTLGIQVNPGTTLSLGDTFVVLTTHARMGVFDAVQGALVSNNLTLAPVYDHEGVTGLSLIAAVPGDVNFDQVVDIGDLAVLGAHWGSDDGLWITADFNLDGTTDITDLGILGANWSTNNTMSFEQALQTTNLSMLTPEPAAMVVVMIGCIGGVRRQR